jgi:hypothetical protein
VIPVIVEGEPGDPLRECFPPALRFKIGVAGALTDEREEPIAADARPQGDGKEIAKQKVVAGLLGVALDEILRRAERASKRRKLTFIGASVAGAAAISATALGWTGVEIFFGRFRSADDLNSARDAADLCEDAGVLLDRYTVPEGKQITLAYECVTTLTEALDGLPRDLHLPRRVIAMFRKNLDVLRGYSEAGKLTSEQSTALSNAEDLVRQID